MLYALTFLLMLSGAWALGDPNFIPANPPTDAMTGTTDKLNKLDQDPPTEQKQEEDPKKVDDNRYDPPPTQKEKEEI